MISNQYWMKTFFNVEKNPNYKNPARKVASYQAQSRRLWSCTRRQQRSCPALSWCCRSVAMRGLPSRWSWSEALPLITDIIVPTAAVAERVLRRQLMLADRWLAVHFRRSDNAAAGGRHVRRLQRRWWWWWTTTAADDDDDVRRFETWRPPVGLDAKTTTVAF